MMHHRLLEGLGRRWLGRGLRTVSTRPLASVSDLHDLWPISSLPHPPPPPGPCTPRPEPSTASIPVPEAYLSLLHRPSDELDGECELHRIVAISGCDSLRVHRSLYGTHLLFTGRTAALPPAAVALLRDLLETYVANTVSLRLPFYVTDPRALALVGMRSKAPEMGHLVLLIGLQERWPALGFSVRTHRLDAENQYRIHAFLRHPAALGPVEDFIAQLAALVPLALRSVKVLAGLYRHLYDHPTAVSQMEAEFGVVFAVGDLYTLFSPKPTKSVGIAGTESNGRPGEGLQKACATLIRLSLRFDAQYHVFSVTSRVQRYLRSSAIAKAEILSNPEVYVDHERGWESGEARVTVRYMGTEASFTPFMELLQTYFDALHSSLVVVPISQARLSLLRQVFPVAFQELTTRFTSPRGTSECYLDRVNEEIVIDHPDPDVAMGVKKAMTQRILSLVNEVSEVWFPYGAVALIQRQLPRLAEAHGCYATLRHAYMDDQGQTCLWLRARPGAVPRMAALKHHLLRRIDTFPRQSYRVVRIAYRMHMILGLLGYPPRGLSDTRFFPQPLHTGKEYDRFRRDLRRRGPIGLPMSPKQVAYAFTDSSRGPASQQAREFLTKVRKVQAGLRVVKVAPRMLAAVLGTGPDAIKPQTVSPLAPYSPVCLVEEFCGPNVDVLIGDTDWSRRDRTYAELQKRVRLLMEQDLDPMVLCD